ncbi:MAG: flavin reductase family protein [Solirubrobacterales bacterium]
MIVEVDLTSLPPAGPRLLDSGRFDQLHVRALSLGGERRWDELAAALAGAGRIEGEQALLSPEALAALAGELAAEEGWRRGFAEMLDQARAHRWVGAAGELVAHVEWEAEMLVEPDAFRHVLGHYPTGVALVTADRPSGPVGMTCNSFTSVSLRPPLVAVCPAKSSETWPEIRRAGRFVVNLVHSDHEEVVRHFAAKGADRFASVSYHRRECGPAIDDALAWIECRLDAEHDAGDHTIAIGRVTALQAREGVEPLVFFRGEFGTFNGNAKLP